MRCRSVKLDAERLKEYPVWAWDDAQERKVPVPDPVPLPEDRGTLFVRASLRLSGGRQLSGYVVGLGSVYAIGVFVGHEEVVLNANLPSSFATNATAIQKIAAYCGEAENSVLPITYQAEFGFAGKGNIEGKSRLASAT